MLLINQKRALKIYQLQVRPVNCLCVETEMIREYCAGKVDFLLDMFSVFWDISRLIIHNSFKTAGTII